jgi:putative colanic acid biosynthesis acetyltransferase WcaF
MRGIIPASHEADSASYDISHRALRLAWTIVWWSLASWTPTTFRRWRVFLLRSFGASIGESSDVRGSARVWYPPNLKMGRQCLLGPRVTCYNVAPVILDDLALVSQGAHLCTGNHDLDDPSFQLFGRPITLERFSWIAADAFVAPGVVVGEGAVLGARGVALTNLDAWKVYVGNPAIVRRSRVRHVPIRYKERSNSPRE